MNAYYKIEISLSPNFQDNRYKPYYWVVLKRTENNWCNEEFGWEETPEIAWSEAYKFYVSFILTD